MGYFAQNYNFERMVLPNLNKSAIVCLGGGGSNNPFGTSNSFLQQ
jgi:hypothetical protein